MFGAAFVLGLVGSLHCVGMCGPLTLLLPQSAYNSYKYILGRILYNSGRVITYTVLGASVGFFGEKLSFFISQKSLSISIGIILLLYILLPGILRIKAFNLNTVYKFTGIFKSFFGRIFKNQSLLAQLSFGLVNGLLPCGMVYAALATSFVMSTWQDSALNMTFFGLGTLPLMLPVSLGIHKLRQIIGNKFNLVMNISYVLLGIWLIYRGFMFHTHTLYTAPGQKVETECITPH